MPGSARSSGCARILSVMENGYLAPALSWYASHARDLPWRRPGASPWAILVSEVMLQQTPVARVLPAYEAWLARWPTPRSLAGCAPGEAVRQWGRLGYPRRALRLHAAAQVITEEHAGQVPAERDALAALPGIGSYTAAAVASFAFGQRHAVLDTNVRRVLARLVRRPGVPASQYLSGRDEAGRVAAARQRPGSGTLVGGRDGARCPGLHGRAAAMRELPARARMPLAAGRPPAGRQVTRGAPRYAGSDRQCRGQPAQRCSGRPTAPCPPVQLDAAWPDHRQRARALDGLVADGLAEPLPDGRFALPGRTGQREQLTAGTGATRRRAPRRFRPRPPCS